MTAVVIDNLYARYKDDAKIGIAYLYCDYRKQYEQKAEDLLANLLKQLTQGQAVIPGCIQTLYSNYKNKPKRPPLHELSEALRSISILYSKVFIIVDALDECRTADGCRKSFLSELFNLQAETNTNIFATARFIQEIEEAFKQTSSLNITAKDEDVQKYVTANMSRLPSFVLRNPEVQSEIKTAMSKSADGMFLLVRLHTDSLAQLPTVGDVKQALQNLPRSLDDTYKQAMARIESQSEAFQKLAKKILSWLTWAKTVLFVAELQHAVAVKLGTAELDEEFIPDKEIMGSVCAGLVTIDNESGAIRLAHYTTQQYFRRVGGRWFQDAEANIARLCLTYISFREFESGYCNTDDEFQQRIQLYPLYEYAANHWGFHSRAAPEMQPLILDFLGCEAKVSASGQAIRSGRMAAIHLAAIFGLESIVAYFFDNGYDIDARDANGRTPLWWASEMGQRNVVNLLIDYGAEINSTDYTKHETPLFKALELGREDIIRLLLENGADANLIANGLTALSYPIEEKDQGTVKLLLENGANVNLMDNGGYPPLVYAIRKKDNGIIRLLLENGADINLMNTKGYPALFYAITQKDRGIIRLLLENGADVNVFDNKGRPMLLHAITQKDQGIVRLLQENGADVNISYNGFPALVWAIIGGDEGIVRVLLEIGADVNLIDASGYSALTHAIMYQDEGIARLLLENGADVNCLIQGDTPLSIAIMMRKESMGNLLLEYGGKTWIGY
ncbi:hypothetical protein TrVGV298_004279 [Trichoderma virens]|nr:hypothetical protein TrVGV298_004279 [Trichoderma virens]